MLKRWFLEKLDSRKRFNSTPNRLDDYETSVESRTLASLAMNPYVRAQKFSRFRFSLLEVKIIVFKRNQPHFIWRNTCWDRWKGESLNIIDSNKRIYHSKFWDNISFTFKEIGCFVVWLPACKVSRSENEIRKFWKFYHHDPGRRDRWQGGCGYLSAAHQKPMEVEVVHIA